MALTYFKDFNPFTAYTKIAQENKLLQTLVFHEIANETRSNIFVSIGTRHINSHYKRGLPVPNPQPELAYTVEWTVGYMDEETFTPIEDAEVEVKEGETIIAVLNTNALGVVQDDFFDGEYTYSVTKFAFINIVDEPLVVEGINREIQVVMTPAI